MPWIGIQCKVEEWELLKYADLCRRSGGDGVADVLADMARLLNGASSGMYDLDRMREVEARAVESIERKRAAVAKAATAAVGRLMADGADGGVALDKFMTAAGVDGWRGGLAAGDKNGGTARRKRTYVNGKAVRGVDGGVTADAQRGTAALTPSGTLGRDRRYGESFEGWAAAELRRMGFKMGHVARGIGLSKEEAWRHLSGYCKHWKREGLRGRPFPGPKPGWPERLAECKERAEGAGLRGAHVVLNGGGLKGTVMEDDGTGGSEAGNTEASK